MSWEMEYKKRLKTADEALGCVKSGMRVYIQPGCAEPETLIEALMRRAPDLFDVEIVHMMTMGCAPYVAPEMAGHFRHNAMFIGANVREAINDGRADYTPIYLSEIEGLFESGQMPLERRFDRSLAARFARILQLRRRCRYDTDCGQVRPARGGADQRSHAPHLRRQLYPRQRHRLHCGVVASLMRAEEAGGERTAGGHRPQCSGADR